MRTHWLPALLFGLLLSACSTFHTAPTGEERMALAPTGKLRAAFLANTSIHATRDLKSGVAIDLGNELARRIGVPLEVVTYPTVAALFNSVPSGQWDIIFTGIAPDRAKIIDFSEPYAQIEMGFLVGKDAPIATTSEIDKSGVRIAVVERGAADVLLTPTIRNATLVRNPTVAGAVDMVKTGKADAFVALKTFLFPASEQVPGSRVLDGRVSVEGVGIGVPKGNAVGVAYVRKFVDEAKASGFVKATIERAGVRGLNAAP
ncbi:MAG: hypothetical protein A2038_07525 [Deltaproteobacteria bacterium GWA2_57_13]|nr:MAG: hypothetical protein A2038_07525 [Deltaproteobacteria bacterium GWA2_57_13]